VSGSDQVDWARLPERVRRAIRSAGADRFGEEHQSVIRDYFETLSRQEE